MKTIPGNLLDIDRGILVHQVNTLGIMGGGIALQIREKWPEVYEEYRFLCRAGKLKLGEISIYGISDDLYIVNLAGQSKLGGLATEYGAYELAIPMVKELATETGLPVFFPYGIGCGLAGGDWKVMSAILERLIAEATLVKFEPINS